jgi:hypothetical protein
LRLRRSVRLRACSSGAFPTPLGGKHGRHGKRKDGCDDKLLHGG